jgi:hypothetical protein
MFLSASPWPFQLQANSPSFSNHGINGSNMGSEDAHATLALFHDPDLFPQEALYAGDNPEGFLEGLPFVVGKVYRVNVVVRAQARQKSSQLMNETDVHLEFVRFANFRVESPWNVLAVSQGFQSGKGIGLLDIVLEGHDTGEIHEGNQPSSLEVEAILVLTVLLNDEFSKKG